MINTLDSLWGHKNKRFLNFGYAAAKIDDVANYLPSRLTAPFIILIGSLLFHRSFESVPLKKAFKILKRDGGNHPSPNSGLSEAAMAGILGIRLGGLNHYDGHTSNRPFMGEALYELNLEKVRRTQFIGFFTSLLFLITFLALEYFFLFDVRMAVHLNIFH